MQLPVCRLLLFLWIAAVGWTQLLLLLWHSTAAAAAGCLQQMLLLPCSPWEGSWHTRRLYLLQVQLLLLLLVGQPVLCWLAPILGPQRSCCRSAACWQPLFRPPTI